MLDIDIADLKKISELIYQKYNYDFRNYAMSSFKRRVLRILELKKLSGYRQSWPASRSDEESPRH